MPRTLSAVLSCVLSLLASACASHSEPNVIVTTAGAVEEGVLGWKSERDQTIRLATQGDVDVDLDIFAGDVTVVCRPEAKDTEIALRRIGTFGWGRSDEAVASLGDIHYTATLERNDGRDTAVIRATTEHPEPHFQRVDVVITVPLLGAVKVRTARGDVWVEQNRGPADIVTSRGAIRVMTPWKMDRSMTLVTSDGDVDLRIRGESCGRFDAETVGGKVKARIKYGQWLPLDQTNDSNRLHATLNGGTNPVVMRTSNADIMILVTEQPLSSNPFPGVW
ncbi:MAG: DUF4097 family beta strand repeat-containing protein [Phycisphaerales bacterium]